MSKRISAALLSLLLICGFVDAWAGRRSYVAGDTISYVDMASGIATGNLSIAVNGHFSPLYPIILSAFIWPFQSDSLAEFYAVRAVNFVIFVVIFLIFRAFVSRLLDHCYGQDEFVDDLRPRISRFHLSLLSYLVFAWGCFGLTMVSRVNPDMCVMGSTFAAAAMLLSFKQGFVGRHRFIGFGAILGVGYLFKTIFFPMSFIFIVAAALEPKVRAVKGRLLVAAITFLLIASPLIVALSIKYGHLTYGESGNLSYWTEVLQQNRARPSYVHWQGDPPVSGIPAHPTRRIFQDPDVYEFGSPIVSTYPPWFGTTYWNAGASVKFDAKKQFRAIVRNSEKLAKILWITVPLAALLIAFRCWLSASTVWDLRSLWFVTLANIGIYLLVVIDGRYLAGCLPIFAMIALATVRTPNTARPVGAALVLLVAACVALQCGPRLAEAAAVLVRTRGDVQDERWLVAKEFKKLDVQLGTPVAAIDYQRGFQYWPSALISDWARLARVRVVSEVVQTDDVQAQFWQVSPDRQALVLQALRQTGARIVVASGVPEEAVTSGWTQIEKSRYYYRRL